MFGEVAALINQVRRYKAHTQVIYNKDHASVYCTSSFSIMRDIVNLFVNC